MFPVIFNKQKIKQVLILIPIHRVGLTSYLSPILGQYGIKNSDFITAFVISFNNATQNVLSQKINPDSAEAGLSSTVLTVPVYLTVYKNGKFELFSGFFLIGFLYNTTFKKKRRYFRFKRLYRNYKKLIHLTFLYSYIYLSNNYESLKLPYICKIESSRVKQNYKGIRNSLFAKR